MYTKSSKIHYINPITGTIPTRTCIFDADIAKETGLWVQDVADTLEYLNMIESIPSVRRFKRRSDISYCNVLILSTVYSTAHVYCNLHYSTRIHTVFSNSAI